LKVRVVSPGVGKDLTDHFNAGLDVDAFTPDPSLVVRPRGLSAPALMKREFAPVEWAVHGLLPTGLSILAGSPKVGKSWVCLDLSCAVALGGPALGEIATTQGDVLYLAREDTNRRLQSRLAYVMGGDLDAVPDSLEVVAAETDWVGGEEGIANLTEWAEEVRSPRLVVVDTLGKVEPELGEERRSGNAYSGNYSMMARYKQWADTYNVSLVMVHHDRKQMAGVSQKQGMEHDPFSKISGTRGLTGAADTLLFLETVRGSGEAQLHVTGRDVAEQSIEMTKVGALWRAMHGPEEVR
jgi:RecA-family ATPase